MVPKIDNLCPINHRVKINLFHLKQPKFGALWVYISEKREINNLVRKVDFIYFEWKNDEIGYI